MLTKRSRLNLLFQKNLDLLLVPSLHVVLQFLAFFWETPLLSQRIVLLGRHSILHQSQCNFSQDRIRYVLFKEKATTNILNCIQLVDIVERASRKHWHNAVGSLCHPLLFVVEEEGGRGNKIIAAEYLLRGLLLFIIRASYYYFIIIIIIFLLLLLLLFIMWRKNY